MRNSLSVLMPIANPDKSPAMNALKPLLLFVIRLKIHRVALNIAVYSPKNNGSLINSKSLMSCNFCLFMRTISSVIIDLMISPFLKLKRKPPKAFIEQDVSPCLQ